MNIIEIMKNIQHSILKIKTYDSFQDIHISYYIMTFSKKDIVMTKIYKASNHDYYQWQLNDWSITIGKYRISQSKNSDGFHVYQKQYVLPNLHVSDYPMFDFIWAESQKIRKHDES